MKLETMKILTVMVTVGQPENILIIGMTANTDVSRKMRNVADKMMKMIGR